MATFVDALKRMCDTLVPAGTMVHFAGKSIPTGWLLCNGAAVSRTTYARLYSAIGTTWGTGDGSTTFNLPNTNGRFLEGTTTTSNVGTALSAGLPNITGELGWGRAGLFTVANGAFTGIAQTNSARSVAEEDITAQDEPYSRGSFSAISSNSTYGKSSTVQPNSIYTLIIIKV